MQRPLLPLLGLAATALLLAGCSAASPAPSTPAATRTPSSAATTSAPAVMTPAATPAPSGSVSAAEARYLGFTKAATPSLAALDDGVLIALGREVCSGFAAGDDTGTISAALGDDPRAAGLDPSGAVFVIGAAVATLCPEHRAALQSGG